MHRAAPILGAFERHSPGHAAGLAAHGAQLTIQGSQRMAHTVLSQHGFHAIHRVALGNAAQVELQGGALAGAA
ncbi:hypothetical protein D9M69_663340 [compost metagenome]